ncbi:MAG: thioesterase family protein [Anaerolineales bacterium]|nr:thioesterase family protein [Anaerolineales bacterium]MCX7608310.1 thioesterase family protein [Anaerolineales bacterium]MDW8227339.1 thioesterase family protein [Anaerolineales bacterium]
MTEFTPGLIGEVEHLVTEQDVATRWGSGLVPVYSTPALVGLMEWAAAEALSGRLPAGYTTVGGRIAVRHLAATPVGMKVRARAELIQVEGRKLTFRIEAWDERERIGEAEHDRFLVEEARFMAKVQAKLLQA